MSVKVNGKEVGKMPNPKVYVVGGGFEYIRLMFRLGCDGAKGLDDADVVLFTGGEDVNPELYGEAPMAKTHYNRLRDEKEKAIYEECIQREIPMVGICRGGQFLNVMNKGEMYQHVTNHANGNHVARIEVPPFNKGNKRRTIMVTSTHHQMMIPADEGIVLMTANEAFEKMRPAINKYGKVSKEPDIEVVYYDGTHCLCFQPHPEFTSAPAELVDFFEECLDNYIYPHIPLRAKAKTTEAAIIAQVPTTKGKN